MKACGACDFGCVADWNTVLLRVLRIT